jgi:hypothetical protein
MLQCRRKGRPDAWKRLPVSHAALSLALWLSVAACGRLIAHF